MGDLHDAAVRAADLWWDDAVRVVQDIANDPKVREGMVDAAKHAACIRHPDHRWCADDDSDDRLNIPGDMLHPECAVDVILRALASPSS